MRALNGTDEAFLRLDTIRTIGSAGGVLVFDGSAVAPGTLTAAALRDRIASVLDEVPALTWRLAPAPDDPARHVWIEVQPDLEQHVFEADLGARAGLRELSAAVTELNARPLQRGKPLWEMHVLTGLPDRRVAIFFRFQHALADGAAASNILNRILPPDPEASASIPQLSTGPSDAGTEPTPEPPDAPATRFNRSLCGTRDVVFADVPVARMLELKDAAGVSFVGLLIAAVTGAIRSWLAARDELPTEPLLAIIPTADRRAGEGAAHGNRLGAMYLSLPTDVPDPRRRLRLVHERLQAGKRAMAPRDAPVPLAPRRATVTITSMPSVRRVWAGAPLEATYPVAVVAGTGLVVAAVTSGDTAALSINADHEQGEGGWSLMDAILDSLAELEAVCLQPVSR